MEKMMSKASIEEAMQTEKALKTQSILTKLHKAFPFGFEFVESSEKPNNNPGTIGCDYTEIGDK